MKPHATQDQAALWSTPSTPKSLHEMRLSAWPVELQPSQRLHDNGAAALSDAEILALILGNNGAKNPVLLASELIAAFSGWHGLQKATTEELARYHGMNRKRAAQIKAALEIARRTLLTSNGERLQIRSPADAAGLLMAEMSHLDQEHFRTIILNTKNRVMKIQTVYIGTINSALIRIGEVFKEALRLNAAAMILVHNHPSGDASPSPEDIQVTRQIVEAGETLEVEILDHLVIGHGQFASMRERGLGFGK